MTNKRSCCIAIAIVAVGMFGILTLGGVYYCFSYACPWVQEEQRVLAAPPSILVHSPKAGDRVPAGSSIQAAAMITGKNPIGRVEIWLDREIAGTQSPKAAGQNTFYASVEVEISEGSHMLYWRAVDTAGLVGQTSAIPIMGEAVAQPVSAAGDQNLEDIAGAQGVDIGDLQKMNPDLGGGKLPEGTTVIIPPRPRAHVSEPAPIPVTPDGAAQLEPAVFTYVDIDSLIPILLRALPAAPSLFQAGFKPCMIRLIWNDNATNESGFDIWMQAEGGPPTKIHTTQARPGTGWSMFEFDSPSAGRYGFWVEAVNGLGGQPTEIAWIDVEDPSCGEGIATYLEVEGLGMQVAPGWTNIYCYLSLEEAQHQHVPPDGQGYMQPDSMGLAEIHKWIGGANRILVRIPADRELSLSGDCWGFPGALPESMGEFSVSIPQEQWDNRTLHISKSNFDVAYRVRPFGPTQAEGAFWYEEQGLTRPDNVTVEARTSKDVVENAERARMPTIRWTWSGNSSDITGFGVYIDGAGPRTTGPGDRDVIPILASACGGRYEIQVAAQSDHARSPFSESVFYDQPPCPVMAEVTFLTARSDITDDYSWVAVPGRCDALGVYYRLWAVNTTRKEIRVGTSQVPLHYKCKTEYEFTKQLGAETATILIPIDPAVPELRIGTEFWESDDWGDDRFGVTSESLPYSYEQWPQVDEDVILQAGWMDGTADITILAHVRGFLYPGQ